MISVSQEDLDTINNGGFPVVYAIVKSRFVTTTQITVYPTKYKIEYNKATMTVPYTDALETLLALGFGATPLFYIHRSVTYTEEDSVVFTSPTYFVYSYSFNEHTLEYTLLGDILPQGQYLHINPNDTALTILENAPYGVHSNTSILVQDSQPDQVWYDFQFGQGDFFDINNARELREIYASKYLLTFFGRANSVIYAKNNSNYQGIAPPSIEPMNDAIFETINEPSPKILHLTWVDENGLVSENFAGSFAYRNHHLGFILSTEDTTSIVSHWYDVNTAPYRVKQRPDPRVENGDTFYYPDSSRLMRNVIVTEEWQTGKTPVWIQTIESYTLPDIFASNPRISNLTPSFTNFEVSTLSFDNILSPNNKTLLSALDTLDDHTHNASGTPITDSGGYFTATDVEAALAELAVKKVRDIFGGHGNGGSVPASSTNYIIPFIAGIDTVGRSVPLPVAGTLKNLYIRTASTQPASGSLVIDIYNATAAASTGITITIAANAAAGTYSDTSNTYTYTAGDLLQIRLVNNATGASAIIGGVTFVLESALG